MVRLHAGFADMDGDRDDGISIQVSRSIPRKMVNQKLPSCFASNAMRFQIGDTDDDDCSDTSFCQVSVSHSICSESYVPEDARSNDSRRSWQVVQEDVLSNSG